MFLIILCFDYVLVHVKTEYRFIQFLFLLPLVTLQIIIKKSCLAVGIYSKLEIRDCLQILKISAAFSFQKWFRGFESHE